MATHDERQWDGLQTALALFAAGDVAISELDLSQEEVQEEEVMEELPVTMWNPYQVGVGQRSSWSCTTPGMADTAGVGPWSATPSRSPEQEQEPQEEVVQAPPTPPVWQGRQHTFVNHLPMLTSSATTTSRTAALEDDGGHRR